jgi:hypothetical protein
MKRFILLFFIVAFIYGYASAQTVVKTDTLNEVAIKGNKQIIKRKADRIIYDMQADPESRSHNVLDMLRKVPYVSVDANDNILVKGNTSYRVLVNGSHRRCLKIT